MFIWHYTITVTFIINSVITIIDVVSLYKMSCRDGSQLCAEISASSDKEQTARFQCRRMAEHEITKFFERT